MYPGMLGLHLSPSATRSALVVVLIIIIAGAAVCLCFAWSAYQRAASRLPRTPDKKGGTSKGSKKGGSKKTKTKNGSSYGRVGPLDAPEDGLDHL